MVGVFKRAAALHQVQEPRFLQTSLASSLTGGDRELRRLVDECAKSYTGLAIGSGFVEYEDDQGLGGNGVVGGLNRSQHSGGFT